MARTRAGSKVAKVGPGIEDIQLLIGERVKRARQSKGLTLLDLARRSGLTAGYLSQIENNKAIPSVATMFKIGNVLECPLTFFFERDRRGDQHVVRKRERKTLQLPASKVSCELLSHDLVGKRLDPNIFRFEKGGTTGEMPYSHKEGEVLILVLKGRFELLLEKRRWILDEGDSAHFDATKPHRISNRSEELGELLWVATPPGY
jgi:transcriptional regulator with XRE-family HTH domain